VSLKRVDHIDVAVRDLEAYVGFFKSMGFEEVRRTQHYGLAVEMRLPGDTVVFELHTVKMADNPGVNHIAFLVDEPQATVDEMKARGVAFDREAELVASTGRQTSNFRDPDGFRLQFTD
jgi:glyoxylase I family protein